MHRQFITAAGVALMVGIVAACGVTTANEAQEKAMTAPKSAAPARTSASYALRQGEAVTLGPGTTLQLERVNDSRCKKGAVCVWAGYISYSFRLTNPAGSRDFVLAENMPNAAPTATHDGLTFALETLEPPEPPALHATALPEYRINVRVTIAQPN